MYAKTLWIASSATAGFQAIAAFVCWLVMGAWEMASLLGVPVAIVGFLIFAHSFPKETMSTQFWAGFCGSLAAVLGIFVVFLSPAGLIMLALAVIFTAMLVEAVDDGSRKWFWVHFVCALPLGIGTVFGGLLILAGVGRKSATA